MKNYLEKTKKTKKTKKQKNKKTKKQKNKKTKLINNNLYFIFKILHTIPLLFLISFHVQFPFPL